MKKVNNLWGVLILSSLLINTLTSNHNMALSQTENFDFHVAGNGCNSQVEFDPVTRIVKLIPGLELNAQNELERSVCALRVTTPTNNYVLVPMSIKGNIRNRGGEMTIDITTNSGATILSTLKQTYTTSDEIDLTNLFEPSENPQCGSSEIVGANINVFGTNASIDLDDIQFELRSQECSNTNQY